MKDVISCEKLWGGVHNDPDLIRETGQRKPVMHHIAVRGEPDLSTRRKRKKIYRFPKSSGERNGKIVNRDVHRGSTA